MFFPLSGQNVDAVDLRVLGTGHAASLFLRVLDVLQDLLCDALARRQDRDAGRVAHDEFAAHVPDARLKRQADLLGVKGVLRADDDLRGDVLLA